MTIKSVYVFKNGNIMVFDSNDEQVPELQTNLLRWMREKGYDVSCKEIYTEE